LTSLPNVDPSDPVRAEKPSPVVLLLGLMPFVGMCFSVAVSDRLEPLIFSAPLHDHPGLRLLRRRHRRAGSSRSFCSGTQACASFPWSGAGPLLETRHDGGSVRRHDCRPESPHGADWKDPVVRGGKGGASSAV